MPAGIIATVDDGFATIDFVNQALRAPKLAALVEIGGPGSIETITRDGPRRKYRVPVQFATQAGLLDGDETGAQWSAGKDTGAAAALVAADPNVNPGADNADWHTPVDQYTSANKYVGQVPNATVLHGRPQVYTGSASSYGGSGDSPLHSEVIDLVKKLKAPEGAPEGFAMRTFSETGGEAPVEVLPTAGALNAGFASQDGALGTDPGATQADPDNAAAVNGGLANQDSALGTDPGSTPDVGGGVVAEDFSTVQSTRTDQGQPADAPTDEVVTEAEGAPRPAVPAGDPNVDWKRAELDAYAVWKGIDPSQYANKADLVNALPKGE